jgi:hypothetical protein
MLFKASFFGPDIKIEPVVTKMPNAASVYQLFREKNLTDEAFIDYVLKKNDTIYGKVSVHSLEQLGFFDGINADKNDFARVKFTYSETGWNKTIKIESDWDIDVQIERNGYLITDKTQKTIYQSATGFDRGQRKLHFIKSLDKKFYLVRISDAQLVIDPKFITFIVIQLEPELTKVN